jgi:hypothetical protein
VELIQFFRDERPWSQFWRLLEDLEKFGDSRYVRAQQNDPDVAEEWAKRELDKKEEVGQKWRPEPEEWTLLHELTAQVRDRLGSLAALLADLPTGVKTRHSHPEPFPRPETELDRAKRRLEAEREQAYDAKLEAMVAGAKARWRAAQQAEQEKSPES